MVNRASSTAVPSAKATSQPSGYKSWASHIKLNYTPTCRQAAGKSRQKSVLIDLF